MRAFLFSLLDKVVDIVITASTVDWIRTQTPSTWRLIVFIFFRMHLGFNLLHDFVFRRGFARNFVGLRHGNFRRSVRFRLGNFHLHSLFFRVYFVFLFLFSDFASGSFFVFRLLSINRSLLLLANLFFLLHFNFGIVLVQSFLRFSRDFFIVRVRAFD